jgi:hypothetical protein
MSDIKNRRIFKPLVGEAIGKSTLPAVLSKKYVKIMNSQDENQKKAFKFFLGAFPDYMHPSFFKQDRIEEIKNYYENNDIFLAIRKQVGGSKKIKRFYKKKSNKLKKY